MDGQRSNSHKRRRVDLNRDTSTSTSVAASNKRGSSSTGPHLLPGSRSKSLPVSKHALPPPNQRPSPSKFLYIPEWITRLSHEDVEQLLAEAAARHEDVFQALKSKFRDDNLPQLENQLRIQKQLINTFYPRRLVPDASLRTHIQALKAEEVVDLQETNDEEEDEESEDEQDDLDPPTQVENLLDQNWLLPNDGAQCADGKATIERFVRIFNTTVDAIGPDSTYDNKAYTLRTLCKIAEILIQSSSTAALVVRKEVFGEYRWFHGRAMQLLRQLDDLEAYRFMCNQEYVLDLEDLFAERLISDPDDAVVLQLRSIIMELRTRAARANPIEDSIR
jgi:hypothetical protein